MQLSRTAYRAALFHLSVNPLLVRASIPGTYSASASTYHSPHASTPSSRLYNILFPQCGPGHRTLESIRHSHTMSSSSTSNAEPAPSTEETGETQKQETTQAEVPKEQLYLPPSESSGESIRLDVSSEGGVTLDHLGPMVVNVDGTLSRIGNWEQMTEIERRNTLRVLGKRNKERLEKLRAAEAATTAQE